MQTGRIPLWMSASLVVGTFGILLWAEWRYPLRRTVESKRTRTARNLAMAAVGAIALQLAEQPLTAPLTAVVKEQHWGMLQWKSLPQWVEVPVAVLLLDYTLYVWHVLTHRVSWLWRFHVVHHVDLDLDASTALRFHSGELVLSIVWRVGQILLIGVSPLALSVWQTAVVLSILFHHSNVRLAVETERRLHRVLVTPRMHGIHHSIVQAETNANWSSGLTLWDRLHGTLRLNVPQQEITIGVPAYRQPEEVTLPKLLVMPFGKARASWRLPGGEQPTRSAAPHARDHLSA